MTVRKDASFAYQTVYHYLLGLIEAASGTTEQKLPSLRQLALRLGVSVSTTKYAYALLEDEGRIHAKARFGYFTRPMPAAPVTASSGNLLDHVFASARQPGMLALSSDAPAMLLSLQGPLLTMERELTRQYPRSHAPLYQPLGEPELRAALAERYTRSAHNHWQAEQVYIGADLRSVLELSLGALNLGGSVALVESPCSWAILRQLQAANIRVVEMPLGDDGRFNLPALRALLTREPVRLAVLSSTVNIPQGQLMPAHDKQQVCDWLTERDIWLFENDTWGEFCFSPAPARYRDFADPNKLLVFSTFDKIIGSEAPYGYVLCRQQGAQFHRLFLERGFRLSPVRQKAIARLYGCKRIDQHLITLRAMLLKRMKQLHALLKEHGNDQWQVVVPQGGASFWLKAVRPIDMQRVFERLLTERIVIAPGEIFSQQGAWKQYLRLSYTLDWDKDIGHAVKQLAQAIGAEHHA
ncbi:PLP-dependent aminotransferase family protein [Pseudomonas fluorescens]|uniref:HTH-type transcriptional regulator NorG n=1 Tax=Pseudomonas fluorescens TaxID=294 RepID=A0A5E6TAK9_PSEFL|nr:PLP-dependent aminotransferase family protein [Pseudomonas fluorescens]VVM84938.1 HTH-type transcriptional regulator NorG [Pseudomonas fluorescens]